MFFVKKSRPMSSKIRPKYRPTLYSFSNSILNIFCEKSNKSSELILHFFKYRDRPKCAESGHPDTFSPHHNPKTRNRYRKNVQIARSAYEGHAGMTRLEGCDQV
jgi:hypothetical protein